MKDTIKKLRKHVTTLEEMQGRVQANLEEGIVCPCCGQYCKLYRRALNAQMARFLIWLVREFEARPRWIDWHEAPSILRGGDYAKLQYWGMIENCPNDNPGQRTSGLWRPTELGVEFAHMRRRAASHAYVFNNSVVRFEDQYITIEDALGEHFNYRELMRGNS